MRRISARDALWIAVPALIVLFAAFWFTGKLIKPAPPKHVVLATGVQGGGYAEFGEQYKKLLARDRIDVELRPSFGSVENLKLLRDKTTDIGVALVQSGIGQPEEGDELVSLGSVGYEPLWGFCRGVKPINDVPDLKGKRIAVGAPGSGTRELSLALLEANGMRDGAVTILDIGGLDGAEALLTGKTDCLFIIAAPLAGIVRAILYSPGVQVINFARADAYVKRLPFLSKVELPEGAIDLERNAPPHDVTMVAATAELVARDDLHPAIQMLLLQAATTVHSKPGLFQRESEFPSARHTDFPLSEHARRYYQSGRPFLQRYLPFWLANFIDRMWVMILPIIAIAIPLSRIVPPLYQWRVRSRIYRWYGELMFIENELRDGVSQVEATDFNARLDWIEKEVNGLTPPLAYADQLYALRQHIDFVRQKIASAPPQV